ncbi:MAG: glucose-6-phosphate isomerase [Gorillibacterium sp.]|nr:glucose-6-phosphate isomerase [Gorillibacterium sp.]
MLQETTIFDSLLGKLTGENVVRSSRVLGELSGVFLNEEERSLMDPEQMVYEVQMHDSCGEVEGGLFFGVSHVLPGKVGNEYFMTKGHYHQKRNCAEYYWGISGDGFLLLMDESRECRAEKVFPGSLHFIAGHTAHRLVNTGETRLVVGACWPSDAGHDYSTIQKEGFSMRVVDQDGKPTLVPQFAPK